MVKSERYMFYSLRSSALALLACAEIARKAYITLVERKTLAKHISL